jgi:FkbM family methyltransferase
MVKISQSGLDALTIARHSSMGTISRMSNINVIPIPNTPFVVLDGDSAISQFCLQTGRLDWDQSISTVPTIRERLYPGSVVIDAGAYIGDTTKLFEGFGCFVYAIEPREDAYMVLRHNCPNVVCLKRALGRRGQKVSFSAAMSNTHETNLGGRQVKEDPDSLIACLSLDELNLQRCDLIKIDVEGFEPFVLEGAAELIQRTKPVLHIEVNLPALSAQGFSGADSIYDIIRGWGYQFAARQPERVGTGSPWDIVCTPSQTQYNSSHANRQDGGTIRRLNSHVFRYMRPGDPSLQQINADGTAFHSLAGLERAMQDCRDHLQSDPTDVAWLFRLGQLSMASGRCFEAVGHYELLRRLAPDDLTICRAFADALGICERIPAAIREYDDLLKLNPADTSVALSLAAMLNHGGLHVQAVAVLENYMRLSPERADVLEALAQSLCQTGAYQRAAIVAKQATRLAATSSQTWNLLGVIQLCADDLSGAEKSFDHSLSIDPRNGDAHLNLAVTYRAQDRHSEAMAVFEYAMALYHAEPTFWQPAFDKEIAVLSLMTEHRERSHETPKDLQLPSLKEDRILTVCVACYGAFPDYSIRALESIAAGQHVKKYCDVHIGLNECCPQTVQRARELRDLGLIDLLIESPKNLNKDPMLRLLIDSARTPYILWIDDDNHFADITWPAMFTAFTRAEHPFDVAGRIAHWGPARDGDAGYMDFIKARPWWRSNQFQPAKLRQWLPFAPGGVFLARTNYLRKHDFPDRGLVKAMDDVALGEMIQQVGGRLVPLPANLLKMADTDGTRRGEGMTLSDGVAR